MTELEPVCVVIIDQDDYRLGSLNEDIATTLIAVASEDPADWSEIAGYWPRYQSRTVPEYASSLPIDIVEPERAMSSIRETDSWIVLDLVHKRFISGKGFQPIGRDACFAMFVDEEGNQGDPLSVHLPPWWELHEQVDASVNDTPRQTPLRVPVVDRDFLFGKPLTHYLATRILELAATERGRSALDSEDNRGCFDLTIEVHRDWLMTPRDEIDGMLPRQMLHGGIDWIDKLVWGQRLVFEQGGGKIVAAPKHVSGYKHAAMGREEMVMYFDLCREIIDEGWDWCKERLQELNNGDKAVSSEFATSGRSQPSLRQVEFPSLVQFLDEAKTNWLASPFEGGSPPSFIIECSRRRVPRGIGVEIIGMAERESEEHLIDCDCPICNMMADGSFGVGFTSIDGHHLDLDDEFAFSIHETREEWEEQQREFAEMSDAIERERIERERIESSAGQLEEDEFASAWSGGVSDEPLPGDSNGNMKLAFLLAEVISELQRNGADDATVKQLNMDFTRFRTCESHELASAGQRLAETLELAARQFPELTSRVADFQSRIAERLRAPVFSSDDDPDDFPF